MRYEWYLYVVDEGGFRTLLLSGAGDEVAIPDLDPDDIGPFWADAQNSALSAAQAAISSLHGGDEQVFLEENLRSLSGDRLSFSLYCPSPLPLSPSFSHYIVFITPFIP